MKQPLLSPSGIPWNSPAAASRPWRIAFGNEPLDMDVILLLIGLFFIYSRFPELVTIGTGIRLPFSILILMGLTGIAAILKGRQILSAAFSGATAYYLYFTIWCLICVPFSSWRGGSVEMLRVQWIPAFLATVFAVAIIREESHFQAVGKVMALSSLTIVLAGFKLGEYSAGDGRFSMLGGTLHNSNDLSVLICSGLPFFFMPLFGKDWGKLGKIIALPAILLHVIVVLRTGSRASMLSVILILVLLFFFTSAARRVMILVIVSIVMLCGAIMTPDLVIARLKSGFGGDNQFVTEAVVSQRQRKEKFWNSVSLTLQHPVFGVGPGTYLSAQAETDGAEGRRADWLASHNSLTQVSSETGLLGFFLYTGAAVIAFSRLNKARKLCASDPAMQSEANITMAFQLSFSGIFLANLFGSNAYVFFMPIIVGLSDGIHAQVNRKYAILRSKPPEIPVRHNSVMAAKPRPNYVVKKNLNFTVPENHL